MSDIVTNIPRPTTPPDRAWVVQAASCANLPSLVMSLYQLTGDERWLGERYHPTRPRGTSDHDDGGFSDDIQAEIRHAAVDAILAWAEGHDPAVRHPEGDLLHKMMTIDVADDIPLAYAPMMAIQMGFADPAPLPDLGDAGRDFTVLVVGAGLSGLLAAHRLRQSGIGCIVIEREDSLGGVWRVNGYPGAGVDTPSDLYSFSFFPYDWSKFFAKRDEVRSYFEEFADAFDLRKDIRFNTDLQEARWDDDARLWRATVRAPDGESTIVAHAILSGVGVFSEPKIVHFDGEDEFEGEVFHSANWPEDLDVTGKDITVVGSGASAMQIVPRIADRVRSLTVIQRSAQWSAPAAKYWTDKSPEVHWLMRSVPFYRQWYRFRLQWMFNDQVFPTIFRDPGWVQQDRSVNEHNERHRASLERYVTRQLEGHDRLLPLSMPDYPPYGRRMLIDNGWFEALKKPHVELVNEGVAALTPHGVRSVSGREWPSDVVVLSTGFHSAHFIKSYALHGRDGVALHDEWGADDARAHLGITVSGFPNFFIMYGPNVSGTGGSYMSLAETQIAYIVKLISRVAATGGTIEPTVDAQSAYNRLIAEKLDETVWVHPKVSSYYRNERGRPVMNSPWSVLEYWNLTLEPAWDDYLIEEPITIAGS